MSSLSRRGFLHGSMGVAGTALTGSRCRPWRRAQAAQVTIEPAEGAKTVVEVKNKAAPSERLRVAVIGCGGRGQSHVDAWSGMEDVELVGLCDADGAHVGQYADKVERKQGKLPQLYEDMRRIFDDKSIDAVSIATQNHWHALATIWAVQSGQARLCREAGEPQRVRGPADGRLRPPPQEGRAGPARSAAPTPRCSGR